MFAIGFLLVGITFPIAVHAWAHRKNKAHTPLEEQPLPHKKVLLAHCIPTGVFLTYVLIAINRGSPIAQMTRSYFWWSVWLHLWMPLTLIATAGAIILGIYSFVFALKPDRRQWLPITIPAALLSALLAFLMYSDFPDA